MRATDDDRHAVEKHIQEAFSHGALNHEEMNERVSGVMEAVNISELQGWVADLPSLEQLTGKKPGKPHGQIAYAFNSSFTPTIIIALTAILGAILGASWGTAPDHMNATHIMVAAVCIIGGFITVGLSIFSFSNVYDFQHHAKNTRWASDSSWGNAHRTDPRKR